MKQYIWFKFEHSLFLGVQWTKSNIGSDKNLAINIMYQTIDQTNEYQVHWYTNASLAQNAEGTGTFCQSHLIRSCSPKLI